MSAGLCATQYAARHAAASLNFLFLTTAQIFDTLALESKGLNPALLSCFLAGFFGDHFDSFRSEKKRRCFSFAIGQATRIYNGSRGDFHILLCRHRHFAKPVFPERASVSTFLHIVSDQDCTPFIQCRQIYEVLLFLFIERSLFQRA